MSTIAITGCSTGFGRVTTRRFLREGWRVIATVRRDADADAGDYGPLLERLRQYVQNQEGQGFPPELFADTIWRICRAASPRTRYAIPAGMGRMMWLRRLLPDAIFDRQVRRALEW